MDPMPLQAEELAAPVPSAAPSLDASEMPAEQSAVEAGLQLPGSASLPLPPMPEEPQPTHQGLDTSEPATTDQVQGAGSEAVAGNSAQVEDDAAARDVRKRRQRWGPPANAPEDAAEEAPRKKKRRSRWETDEVTTVGAYLPTFPKEVVLPGGLRVVLPSSVTGETSYTDPKLNQLHAQLNEYNRKLTNNELDIPPEGQRSPSPEPIYDKSGIRLNTREIRYREKLLDKRNRVVEELLKEDATFKPPPDYKPRKYQRKIFIPIQEHPGYNFIGLIIGPRGNTQKRMQSETNTKIAIRGRGSVKEGASRDPKYDYGEDEELHVLITGEKQEEVDNAYIMIERLLRVDDDELNEHKRLQLRELARLNGTLKDEQPCFHCGELGHRPMDCPKAQQEVYVLPQEMQVQVQQQYQRDIARVHGTVSREDEEYRSFMRDLGGAPPPEMMGGDDGGERRERSGREPLPDDCKLYVANLSPAFNEAMLQQMFEPFGTVTHTSIMKDGASGASRGFGFVHFSDAGSAKVAAEGMNGRTIDGKALIVRLRSEGPQRGQRIERGERPIPQYDFDESKLYVCYLPPSVTEPQLQGLFGRYGPVGEVKLILDKVTGLSKGYAFVTMGSPGSAQAAIRGLNNYKVEGKSIGVKVAGTGRDAPSIRGGPGAGPHMMYPSSAPPPGYGPPPPGYGPPPGAPPPPHPYGAPPPYPYAPPPAAAPPPYPYAAPPAAAPPPAYGHYPPPGAPHAAPPPYGAPPPYPYAAPPAAPPPAYGGYPPAYGAYPPHAAAAPPPPEPGAPLPPGAPPPLPSGPPPDQAQVQNEYEKFMSEMQSTFR